MERLGRGLVAIRTNETQVYVGWRLLGNDAPEIGFNVYRATDGGVLVKLNEAPLTATTDFIDRQAPQGKALEYTVRAMVGETEQPPDKAFRLAANAPVRQYLEIPLQTLPGNTPNDASVGDLDGDGEYEIILKQEMQPFDNSQSGQAGETKLEAYKLDGTLLWRINLGRNIREGAHYTQFLVYDFDGDGKAEIACKTADGTTDGKGKVIGEATADFRNAAGYVLSGPEYLTIFDGLTGAALATTAYLPPRGSVADWGDNYGNRVDRFLACVAYLDGVRPSLVMARGYYTRTVLAAWDWREGELKQRWIFDSRDGNAEHRRYEGQGNHSLSVGDVDGDGRDEIMYGACAIDDDGKGLFVTGLGHGDALHMSDMDPDRPGLEAFQPHETPSLYGPNGSELRDARTGALIFGINGENADVGRGVAFDIDPRYRGYEVWAARGGLHSVKGELITTRRPGQMNFGVWWDADPLRELLDNITISKWNWTTSAAVTMLTGAGAASNNGTKATPALAADLLGDWREEVILRAADNQSLRLYTTTIPATHRMCTLMHDRQYRMAVAWQNIGYNQPPHPGFYLGDGMNAPPVPRFYTVPVRTFPTREPMRRDTGLRTVVQPCE